MTRNIWKIRIIYSSESSKVYIMLEQKLETIKIKIKQLLNRRTEAIGERGHKSKLASFET